MKELRRRAKSTSSGERKGSKAATAGRFRGRTIAVLLALVVAGSAAGLWFYTQDAILFPLREVVFSGNRHLTDTELKAVMGIPMGSSLVRLSLTETAEKLLKSPWIRDVSIRKDFPGRLSVALCEAVPFAILEMNGRTFLLDEQGKMLEEMKDAVPFLPVITADPFKQQESFAEALALAKAVKQKNIATERSRVEIVANRTAEEITLVVDGVVIKVGSGEHDQKLRRFLDLEEEIKRRAITVDYVDLRFANRVVVKPINEVVK